MFEREAWNGKMFWEVAGTCMVLSENTVKEIERESAFDMRPTQPGRVSGPISICPSLFLHVTQRGYDWC